jgi:transposase
LQIDNNDVERMIRPIALGRRNWLFAGSHNGAKMAAAMMTVIDTCNNLKISPQKYLADVLSKLASHNTTSIDSLTPYDWKVVSKLNF